jgi:uncharacterized paraquat-inducible protein A
MIYLDFHTAVTLLLALPLVIIFVLWLFYNFHQDTVYRYPIEGLHQCPFCTYVFMVFAPQPLLKCPRCQSLISSEDEAQISGEENENQAFHK